MVRRIDAKFRASDASDAPASRRVDVEPGTRTERTAAARNVACVRREPGAARHRIAWTAGDAVRSSSDPSRMGCPEERMRKWIIGTAAAVAGGVAVWTAPDARAFGPLVLDFQNVATGDVSLVYTRDFMGPIPVWGFGQGGQVSAYVKSVKGSNVLGVRSNDSSTRVVVGIGTATGGGA